MLHLGPQLTIGGKHMLDVQWGAAMQGGREGIWPEKIRWFASSLANETALGLQDSMCEKIRKWLDLYLL